MKSGVPLENPLRQWSFPRAWWCLWPTWFYSCGCAALRDRKPYVRCSVFVFFLLHRGGVDGGDPSTPGGKRAAGLVAGNQPAFGPGKAVTKGTVVFIIAPLIARRDRPLLPFRRRKDNRSHPVSAYPPCTSPPGLTVWQARQFSIGPACPCNLMGWVLSTVCLDGHQA
jgi:hypothetical protein